MHIQDFLHKQWSLLPGKWDDNPSFYAFVEKMYKEFNLGLKELDKSEFRSLLDQSNLYLATEVSFIHMQERICHRILKILEHIYKGNIYEAIRQLNKLFLTKYETKGLSCYYYELFSENERPVEKLYRIRRSRKGNSETIDNCNHVPFPKRWESCKVERFNLLAYPCLYLCNNLRTAYEEVKSQDDTYEYYYSKFKFNEKESVDEGYCIFDLTLPDADDMQPKQIIKYLLKFPILLICLTQGKKMEVEQREEYLFSQLLFHLLTIDELRRKGSDNRVKRFFALKYSSIKNMKFHNYVIPATVGSLQEMMTENHSKRLKHFVEEEEGPIRYNPEDNETYPILE